MHRFTDKTAIVTGGSRGIGRGIAERLAREGAEVLITGRNAETLEAAAAEMRRTGLVVWTQAGDVCDDEVIARMVEGAMERWGRVDVLCNNAAFTDVAPFLDVRSEQWDQVLGVALRSPFLLSQAVARHMVEAGGGAIVNIASIGAHGGDGNSVYAAAKAALLSITRDIATELGPRGVRCVAVSPGWVDTPMLEENMPPDLLARLRAGGFARVPLQRLIRVEEVAAAVAFAASDEASGVTGSELLVDGGVVGDIYVSRTL